MKKVLSAFVWLTSKIIGRKNLEHLLIFSAKTIDINLQAHGLSQNGGSSSNIMQINGEEFFIEETLTGLYKSETEPVFFDVGANVGDYSLVLRKYFPKAKIYSFEPVKSTFDILAENTGNYSINAYNIGFSNSVGIGELFNTVNNDNSEVTSAYKDVFAGVFDNTAEVTSIEFQMDTIDHFCQSNNITNIDFLKIDVEGHELSVLKGTLNMLSNRQIKIIQFEFNTHNVYSRVFLKDFYSTLDGFEFFRLVPNGLIRLGSYNAKNEIFTLHNILAVRKDLGYSIESKYLG